MKNEDRMKIEMKIEDLRHDLDSGEIITGWALQTSNDDSAARSPIPAQCSSAHSFVNRLNVSLGQARQKNIDVGSKKPQVRVTVQFWQFGKVWRELLHGHGLAVQPVQLTVY